METIIAAAIGALATISVAVIGAVVGRRWGLPGLGRMVEVEQTALISTLRARIEALEDQAAEDAKRIEVLEKCTEKLADLERQLRDANADIAALSRQIRSRRTIRGD